MMKAHFKKSFFQHDQVMAKVSFTQQKKTFTPGVAGAILETVTE